VSSCWWHSLSFRRWRAFLSTGRRRGTTSFALPSSALFFIILGGRHLRLRPPLPKGSYSRFPPGRRVTSFFLPPPPFLSPLRLGPCIPVLSRNSAAGTIFLSLFFTQPFSVTAASLTWWFGFSLFCGGKGAGSCFFLRYLQFLPLSLDFPPNSVFPGSRPKL